MLKEEFLKLIIANKIPATISFDLFKKVYRLKVLQIENNNVILNNTKK